MCFHEVLNRDHMHYIKVAFLHLFSTEGLFLFHNSYMKYKVQNRVHPPVYERFWFDVFYAIYDCPIRMNTGLNKDLQESTGITQQLIVYRSSPKRCMSCFTIFTFCIPWFYNFSYTLWNGNRTRGIFKRVCVIGRRR